MTDPFAILLLSAATLGTFHTAIGLDHSLPFVLLAKTRGWTLRRTLGVTLMCGLGHVFSSVAIAAIGLGLGIAGSQLSLIEQTRGSWAAWLLVGFGLAYAAIAWWKSRGTDLDRALFRTSRHRHDEPPGADLESPGADLVSLSQRKLTPSLFVIFLLGPCETLLPLLTASGMTLSLVQSLLVTLIFCLATICTMVALVALGFFGASLTRMNRLLAPWEKHAPALAGLALAASGMSIQVLGI